MRLALQHHARKLKSPRTLHFHVSCTFWLCERQRQRRHSICTVNSFGIAACHRTKKGMKMGKWANVKEMERRCRRRYRRNTQRCVNFSVNFLLHLEWNKKKKRLQATASNGIVEWGCDVASGRQKNDVATPCTSRLHFVAMAVATTQSVLRMLGRMCSAWNTSPVEFHRIESLAIYCSLSERLIKIVIFIHEPKTVSDQLSQLSCVRPTLWHKKCHTFPTVKMQYWNMDSYVSWEPMALTETESNDRNK